jgi:hypothetical protein
MNQAEIDEMWEDRLFRRLLGGVIVLFIALWVGSIISTMQEEPCKFTSSFSDCNPSAGFGPALIEAAFMGFFVAAMGTIFLTYLAIGLWWLNDNWY